MKPRRFFPILALAILVLLAVVTWIYPSSQDFRAENPFWNGLKTFTARFGASPLRSLDDLPPRAKGTTLLVIPYLQFTESELEKLKDHVSLGGTLIVLDDYGYGNEILDYLGLNMRFSGGVLLDPLFNYKNAYLPKVTHLAPTALTGGVESLILNHASSLSGVSQDETIASSSKFSFLDLDNNSAWDTGEPVGPLPVVAHTRMGEGHIILIADPSILINGMEGMDSNYILIKNALEIETPDPEILIDQSHLPGAPLDEAKGVLSISRAIFSTPMGTMGLIAAMLALTLSPVWSKKGDNID